MYIHEVCQQTGLTRKAIEYYEAHGLIHPAVEENGYRSFGQEEVQLLKKAAVLRRLGLSVAEMAEALEGSLHDALARQEVRHSIEQERLELLRHLAATQDWEAVRAGLAQLERKQTLMTRLLEAFPGAYGTYLAWHFAPFLEIPVTTAEQQKAYEEVLSFLDEAPFEVPSAFEAVLDALSPSFLQEATAAYREALRNPEDYVREHQEAIRTGLAEYAKQVHSSDPAIQAKAEMKELLQASGYYERFIPAMLRLSPTYQEHHAQIHRMADLLQKTFPEWNA